MMTNRTWAGTCGAIVAAATVAVMAQTQTAPPPRTQTPPPQTSTATSPDQITVTGCLKAAPPAAGETAPTGTAGATGTSGTAGAAGAATDANAKFVLTNATVGPAAAPSSETSAAGSAGAAAGAAAGTQASADHGQTYRLVANPASLSPHVGKKLELTGTIVKASSSASAEPPASPANAPELRVEKGKVIAASCEQ
jgi:hypothetical protein